MDWKRRLVGLVVWDLLTPGYWHLVNLIIPRVNYSVLYGVFNLSLWTKSRRPWLKWNHFGSTFTQCECVLPTGRSFLIVLDLRRTSWPLHKGCNLLSIQHSRSRSTRCPLFFYSPPMTNRTRPPSHRVWPSQTLCLLLITDMMALSRLRTSGFFKVQDLTPYRRVLQMTVFIILFFFFFTQTIFFPPFYKTKLEVLRKFFLEAFVDLKYSFFL